MDDDEMEVTREELQILIRDSVNRSQLMSENVRRKCNQLHSLLERKEKLSTDLFMLFGSVSKCEAIVRQLYSKLGWEYEDTESDGNNFSDGASNAGAVDDETDDMRCASPVSNNITAADSDEGWTEETTEEKPKIPEVRFKAAEPLRELRVVLTRLPKEPRPQGSPRPSTSKRTFSDDELSIADSDYTPSGGSSSDSDFLETSTKTDWQKKKKLKFQKVTFKANAQEMPVSQPASSVHPTKSEPPASSNGTNGAIATVNAPNLKTEVKTETKPFAVSEKAKVLPPVLEELKLNMKVLARRKQMVWETGSISEIVEKEDGTKKFKVTFEDKGKVLVSGHHIAYFELPKLVHLTVGGRVVSKYNSKNNFYSPGILGELPSRKNHMRFLVFLDDQKTSYVALPVLRLISNPSQKYPSDKNPAVTPYIEVTSPFSEYVNKTRKCRPRGPAETRLMPDPLDDIRDDNHKKFLKEYLERMPYPPHTQFRVDQKIKVERDGVLEKCSVSLLDCSLMEVVYAKDEEKEWIYRGSIRLEHIICMKEPSKT